VGDERAEILGRLFEAHRERLFRLARRLSGDAEEARDLVQEAFVRLARGPSAVREGDEAERWLVRVLVNLCHDRSRRLRVRREAAARAAQPPTGETFEDAVLARAVVQAALAELPARRRAVVVLHELEGRDTAEIAGMLGMARVTVRWHLHAGHKQLRAILDPKGVRDER
jgi:RNA polymerase sigma-70 factor (ECF subfamily)